ncbi:hypothetical protein G9A89_015954 [Geosiphon pyriformis]|nr:hypothetical protein G9A89_015954 [Geosiphon pyriformis]
MVRILLDCNLSLGSSLANPFWFHGFSLIHPSVLNGVSSLNILESNDFAFVCNYLSQAGANSLSVYTDEFLSNLNTVGYRVGIATFFENIYLDLDIVVLVSWHKVKDHSGVSENEHADIIAGNTSLSNWYLPSYLGEHFIMADSSMVSDNSRHFIHNIYHSVFRVHWEIGFGSKFLADGLLSEINWLRSSLV